MKNLLITYVLVSDIKPYKNNPKIHKAKQVAQIGLSIKEFSFTNPILLDENNEILAGHGRYLAAKELKLETVPCIILEHLSKEQKKAYRIADNKLVENGKWDEHLLGLELADLSNLDLSFDLSITGFETTEIDLLIDKQSKQNQKEDKIPEITQNPVSKLGDIWILNQHIYLSFNNLDISFIKCINLINVARFMLFIKFYLYNTLKYPQENNPKLCKFFLKLKILWL